MSATVLIVEDEPMIGLILAQKMTREGHHVIRGATVRSLTDSLASSDVALVDATLDADGIAAMESLRGAGIAPRAGWFALLDSRSAGDGPRAVRAGAAGVVLKPFKPTAVAAQVTALLGVGSR